MSAANQLLNDIVDRHRNDIVQAAIRLIGHESVLSESQPGAPFGPNIARALSAALELAESLGFRTKTYDGFAAAADFGAQGRQIGVLSHVDVVPAGDGWSHPPFEGTLVDGRLYGRGSIDDKGPMVAALYAMKAIAESGLPIRNHVRHIIGCDEESGFRCIRHYLSKEQQPWGGFSPDGEFPVIHAEKGILRFSVKTSWRPAVDGLRLIGIEGGTRLNVVPASARAVLEGGPADLASVEAAWSDFGEKDKLFLQPDGGRIVVRAEGKSAHASQPWNGQNAAHILLRFLAALKIEPPDAHNAISTLSRLFGDGYFGANLGIKCEDELSGGLTLSMGVLSAESSRAESSLDMRYPVHVSRDMLWRTIETACRENGLSAEVLQDKPPLYVPKNAALVQTLLGVYRDLTRRDEQPVVIGGGTYCRTMENFVAYGPLFPGQKELAHEADEYIGVDDLILSAKIYAQALYVLLQS